MEKELLINDETIRYSWVRGEGDQVELTLEGQTFKGRLLEREGARAVIEFEGKNIQTWKSGNHVSLGDFSLQLENPRDKRKKKGSGGANNEMSSPMPGKILKHLVNVGDSIVAGQGLIVMEAMKMEHTIKAAFDGTVLKIMYQEGELVGGDVDLIDIEKSVED
jgi:biotin carboxyl carrier protein